MNRPVYLHVIHEHLDIVINDLDQSVPFAKEVLHSLAVIGCIECNPLTVEDTKE